jgi:hypothetical protein
LEWRNHAAQLASVAVRVPSGNLPRFNSLIWMGVAEISLQRSPGTEWACCAHRRSLGIERRGDTAVLTPSDLAMGRACRHDRRTMTTSQWARAGVKDWRRMAAGDGTGLSQVPNGTAAVPRVAAQGLRIFAYGATGTMR